MKKYFLGSFFGSSLLLLLLGVTSSLGQSLLLSLVFYEHFHSFQLRASSANDHFACVYRVAGTKILYAQGSQGNLLYEKILDRPGIEPVTLSMVMLNTRAFTASTIWALYGFFGSTIPQFKWPNLIHIETWIIFGIISSFPSQKSEINSHKANSS